MPAIVLFDNDAETNKHLKLLLQSFYLDVLEAKSEKEVLALCLRSDPLALIVDTDCPAASCEEVITSAKDINAGVKIFVTSADEKKLERLKKLNAKANRFLLKPLFRDDIVALMNSLS